MYQYRRETGIVTQYQQKLKLTGTVITVRRWDIRAVARGIDVAYNPPKPLGMVFKRYSICSIIVFGWTSGRPVNIKGRMEFGNAHRGMAYGPYIPEDPFLNAVNRSQVADAPQFPGRLDVYKQ
jgi:hypothetical protein